MTESEIISILKNQGRDKSALKGNGSPLQLFLQDFVNSTIRSVTKRMEYYNISASNNLKQSIAPTKVVVKGDTVEIGVEADFYWKYVNFGVNGFAKDQGAPHWGSTGSTREQFKQSISAWRMDIGMTLGSWEQDNGQPMYSSYDKLDNALMYIISRNGKKGRPFFTDVVNDQLINTLEGDLSALLERIIEIKIIEPQW